MADWGGRKGGCVSRLDGETAATASSAVVELQEEKTSRPVVSEAKAGVDKPEASEEIVIEEISIDGMCGVY